MASGEHSSESGWTISKLCATLVSSETFQTLFETIVISSRRSLIYPIYRHFDLTKKVWLDVKDLLNKGQVPIIKGEETLSKCFSEILILNLCFSFFTSIFQMNKDP